MIPKVIHYCWFGGNPKSDLILKCMASWKQYLPDWEFIEWNESNFDVNMFEYTREAYTSKKWAFVADVARLYAVYQCGGIYMDTDVELKQPFDSLLDCSAFFAFESPLLINTGKGFGAEKGCKLIYDMMMDYRDRPLHSENEKRQLLCTHINTAFLQKQIPELKIDNTYQKIENIVFLPFEEIDVFLKHYNSLSWAEGQKNFKRVRRKESKFLKFLRKPSRIEWIGKTFGKKAKGIYIFFAYDFFDTSWKYWFSRFVSKLKSRRR